MERELIQEDFDGKYLFFVTSSADHITGSKCLPRFCMLSPLGGNFGGLGLHSLILGKFMKPKKPAASACDDLFPMRGHEQAHQLVNHRPFAN